MTEELRAGSMTGEQWVFEERTVDPSSTIEGERWLRTDLNSGDKIATLRVDAGSSILDIPIFEVGTSVDVTEALRIEVNGLTGYIPMLSVSDAAFPELRMQHNSSVYGFHDAVDLNPIPDREDLHAHYDATELALSDGNAVSTWPDETNNGYDLTEGSAPQYVADGINGNPVVSFDGVEDVLDVTFSQLAQPNHVFIAGRYVGGSGERLFQSPDSNARHNVDTGGDGTNFGIYAGDLLNTGVAADTDPHILTARFDGTNSLHRVDAGNVASATGDAGNESMGGIRLAADDSLSDFGEVEVGEVLVYPQDKSSIQSDVEEYLSDKWGITL